MGLPGSEIANLVSAVAVLLVMGAYVLAFHFAVAPFQRDFFCNDDSISYPYKPDTVTMAIATIVGSLIILLSVVVIEIVRHALKHNRSNQSDRAFASGLACCCPSDSRRALATVSIIRLLLLAALGALVNEIVTVTLKTILGRHRPHFMSICNANVTWPDFATPCAAHRAIAASAVCRPDNVKLYKESMLSFPSGHASHSVYMTVFAALYLQSRFAFAKGHAVKWFLQCLVLVWGLAVCASRVSDYKHHWSDVLGGGVIGATVGLLVCLYLRPSYMAGCVAEATYEDAVVSVAATSDGGGGGPNNRPVEDGNGGVGGGGGRATSPGSNMNELQRLTTNQ